MALQVLCDYGSSPEVGGQTAVVTCSVSEAASTARTTSTHILLAINESQIQIIITSYIAT